MPIAEHRFRHNQSLAHSADNFAAQLPTQVNAYATLT
jgi:hypothetical protein